ncbi:MAG: glycerol-3-phosphate 1-O-acyltransferase PlsY [Thomasclavelia sp.]|nr:glycerol-3-phosphate 1-O-acyltransferase PlsY [Thomasclavelia sp.]
MIKIILTILILIISYLYGSIPFALVIGKVFYHTDVRDYGSGNLGGSNAGRVLGKKAGFIVIALDASKAIVTTVLAGLMAKIFSLNYDIIYLAALCCIIGHCYPIFAGFKGGKAVASSFGYFLVINPIGALIALVIFLLVLKISKYVSLSSICAAICCGVLTLLMPISIEGKIINFLIVFLIVYRHKSNINKIKNGTENKVSWI